MLKTNNGKLIVRVAPDIYSDPPLPQVILSDPDEQGVGRIEWQMVKGCGNFEFAKFIRDSSAFQNVVIGTDTIKCDFDTKVPGAHRYDIVIESDGTQYTSKLRGGPPDPGKPVIRN